MPVNRINKQINLRKSDSVILIYGQVNDSFVTSDLSLYNIDGIEKILYRYLKENGYEQIIFYAPERQLYAYDKNSYNFCFPGKTISSIDSVSSNFSTSTSDGRPLGKKKFLKRKKNSNSQSQIPSINRLNDSKTERGKWHNEGFISVVQGKSDIAIVEIIREALFQKKRKSAVIFSQFDNAISNTEIQRLILPLIPRLQRRTTENKCIMISNAIDQEKLKEEVDSIPSLNKIVKMEDAGKGLDSLIYIGYPQKDEIKNLINRDRIINKKKVEWTQFNKIVIGLDQGRDELKRWEKDFQEIESYDILSINQCLTNPLSEDDQAALKKLDNLIGLVEVKNAIRRHILQMQDLLENDPSSKPLMHILLKGNSGTGKTTIARLIAEIFREAGLLERGHLIEVDREKLVAGYVGQTAIKTDKSCRDAFGGVLFVDEAYSLATKTNDSEAEGNSNDFGKEAIDTLIKRMTDWQGSFCVILAGYPEDMDRLLNANPGFSGRIGLTINIADYVPEELTQLFKHRTQAANKIITEDFEEAILNVFTNIYKKRGKKFDNARRVEQLVGKINGYYLERCVKNKLDRKVEPYQIDDIPEEFNKSVSKSTDQGDALDRLIQMIGLRKAKIQIRKQVALVTAGRKREGYSKGRRLHLIFKGNPGTGKTTVARLLGEIYQHYQILTNNTFVEASRNDLVGAFQGRTAKMVEEKCKEALGGILFIDEAYTLINGVNDNYGREAIDTLLKIMEDERENLCVILAGYPDRMVDFLDSNPGLERRFSAQIDFEDYNPKELSSIFNLNISQRNIQLDNSIAEKVNSVLEELHSRRDENFGNAGVVENLIQGLLENHALRCLEKNLDVNREYVLLDDIPQETLDLLPVSNSDEIIEGATKELNELIGLESIKDHVKKLIREYKHEKIRYNRTKIRSSARSYHMIFSGNPGTGKTTVARIIGKIFKALDILKKGDVIEVSRADFLAGYQGQTAEKTRKLIRRAFDNILFIDEAYSLVKGSSDNYGKAAIDTLLKMMEDHRDRLIVIAAGYPRDMRLFLNYNVGLSARFSSTIRFEDFSSEESKEIFKHSVRKKGYSISDELDTHIQAQMDLLKARKGPDFGNARDVDNFLNQVVLPLYMNRVEDVDASDEDFLNIIFEDFPPLPEDGIENEDNQNPVEFSLNQEKNERRDNVSVLSHAGGDIINGDKYVTNNYFGNSDENLPKELTSIPPLNEKSIHGREKIITTIFEQLSRSSTSNKILIYGLPGIGKTVTLIKFLGTYYDSFDHIIWLEVNSSLIKAFIENELLLEYLGVDFKGDEHEEGRFTKIISRLKLIDKKCLLILDNLSVPSINEFKELSLSNIKVIGAAREKIGGVHTMEVSPLENSLAKDIFNSNSEVKVEEELLSRLFNLVSNHPLAIELISTFIHNKGFSLNQVVDELERNKNTEIAKFKHHGKIDFTSNFVTIFKTLFKLDELSFDEKQILIYFAVLPSQFFSRNFLKELFQLTQKEDTLKFNEVINNLKGKGYIQEVEEQGIHCHQIIQQTCRWYFSPNSGNCKILFTEFGEKLGIEIDEALISGEIFSTLSNYLKIIEVFSSYFTDDELMSNRVYLNLSILYRVNGQFEKSLMLSQKITTYLSTESIKISYTIWQNINLRNIACLHTINEQLEIAEECYNEGITLLQKYTYENDSHRNIIDRELMLNYVELGMLNLKVDKHNVPRAIQLFETGLEIGINSQFEYPYVTASLNRGLAIARIEQGNSKLAIETLKEAKVILRNKVKLDEDSLLIGFIDMNYALAYARKKDFINAQHYISQAIRNFENNLSEDNIEFYHVQNVSAIINLQSFMHQFDLGEEPNFDLLRKAEKSITLAIKILQKYKGDNYKDLAIMYSNHGLILKYQDREAEGYFHHLKGLEIYKNMENRNDLVVGMYFRSYYFFQSQITIKDSEDCLEVCYSVIPKEREFMPEVSFVRYCQGILKHRMQEYREALIYLDDALRCIHEYHGKTNVEPIEEKDSPMEVVYLQEMALIFSHLKEHNKAIQHQKDAIILCEANMNPDMEELAEPYVIYSKILLSAANESDIMEHYGQALELKVKASALNPDLVQDEEGLENSGELHLVTFKDKDGKLQKYFLILPVKNRSKFASDYKEEKNINLNDYGYVIQFNKSLDHTTNVSLNTVKYGRLNEEFTFRN